MKGLIVSHRRGKHTQRTNQFLLKADGVGDRTIASRLIGKTVVWKTKNKRIHGKITSLHGNNGVMRVRFSKNASGNVLGQTVEILE